MCNVNLTRIHLLSEVFEHNNNFSRPIILLKRMASGVWSAGILARSAWDTQKVLLSEAWALSMTVLTC